MPAPGPVAGRLETARRLVVGVAPPARLTGLQWRGCLVVDVLAVLNARADRVRQHLGEALHLGRSVGRVDETGPRDNSLKPGHDCAPCLPGARKTKAVSLSNARSTTGWRLAACAPIGSAA